MDKIISKGINKKFKLKENQQVTNNGSVSNEVEVLNGIDLNIRNGEFLVLVGPNGCGKSVFLDIIAGLTNSTGGSVYLDDKPIKGPNIKTGYVFQQGRSKKI